MLLDEPIGPAFGKRPDLREFTPDLALPMSNKYIGIEIEAENIPYVNEDLSNLLYFWTVVRDGSLRNYGSEFVSEMLRGRDIYNALQELSTKLAELKCNPDYSPRTSVHIHVDARHMSVNNLRSLIYAYLVHEPYFFKFLGRRREENSYCIPFYKNPSGIKHLSSMFAKEVTTSSLRNLAQSCAKYEAMNLRSLQEKGSIEFRHHYGTNAPEALYNWICALLYLFNTSKQTPYEVLHKTFISTPYETSISGILQYLPVSKDIDMQECHMLAKFNISRVLLHSIPTRGAAHDLKTHWPRDTRPTKTFDGEF